MRGSRERYELGDMILLRQYDLKQSVQISRASNTYLIAPETAGESATPATDTQKTSSVVNVDTSIADVGDRKPLFGQQARHVMTVIATQMMNIGGMGGFLNNPMLAQMQGGSGGLGIGRSGIDRTAGAAMFMMEQAIAGASSDSTQGGPSFDASLAEALQDGAKKVGDNLRR